MSADPTAPSCIVLAVEFSDCAEAVVDEVATLAHHEGVPLVLLHVATLPVPSETRIASERGRTVRAEDYLVRAAQRRLVLLARLASERGVSSVRTRVEVGDVVEGIVSVAKELPGCALAMGTRGRRGLARLVYGSVAERVQCALGTEVYLVPTRHHGGCEARSCAWCGSGETPEMARVRAETLG